MAKREHVRGLKELNRALGKLSVRARGRALSSSVSQGATVVVREVRKRVPVATGRLRKNIYKFKIKKKNTKHSVSYAVGVRNSQKKKTDDPKNAWYWHFHEFGTKHHAARPYLRPGFHASKREAIKKIRVALLQRIIIEGVKEGKKLT